MAGPEDEGEMDFVAGTNGPRETALRNAMSYAINLSFSGRVEVYELLRIPVPLHE